MPYEHWSLAKGHGQKRSMTAGVLTVGWLAHPVPTDVPGAADCTCGTGDAGHPHGALVRGCPGRPLYSPSPPGCAFPLPA